MQITLELGLHRQTVMKYDKDNIAQRIPMIARNKIPALIRPMQMFFLLFPTAVSPCAKLLHAIWDVQVATPISGDV